MKSSLPLGVIAIILVTMPNGANAATLCNREYTKIDSLIAQLKIDGNVKAFPERKSISVLFDRKSLTLWWVHNIHSENVIVTCKQKVPTRTGYIDGGVQADCNNDHSGTCVEQATT